MPTAKFIHIPNWKNKGPVAEIKFEIIGRDNISITTKTKSFLFDSGNENGLMLSSSHIDDYGLNVEDLGSATISSPGGPNMIQRLCFVTIHEINLNKQNILKKPLERIPLIFSLNPNQTPIIGETCFSSFNCCISYKDQKFSVD